MPALLVRLIGVAELAGALGMLLPGLTKIQPRLTAFAAVGFALIMVLASAFHITRGEFGNLPINVCCLSCPFLWPMAAGRVPSN